MPGIGWSESWRATGNHYGSQYALRPRNFFTVSLTHSKIGWKVCSLRGRTSQIRCEPTKVLRASPERFAPRSPEFSKRKFGDGPGKSWSQPWARRSRGSRPTWRSRRVPSRLLSAVFVTGVRDSGLPRRSRSQRSRITWLQCWNTQPNHHVQFAFWCHKSTDLDLSVGGGGSWRTLVYGRLANSHCTKRNRRGASRPVSG